MSKDLPFLNAEYIIDGIRMDTTPGAMLSAACGQPCPPQGGGSVIDESSEPTRSTGQVDPARLDQYATDVAAALRKERLMPEGYPESYTRMRIAAALLDTLWMKGHFRIGDLTLRPSWKWDAGQLGNMAAFYRSVETAVEYTEGLGVQIDRYSVQSREKGCLLTVETSLHHAHEDTEGVFSEEEDGPVLIKELPFRTTGSRLSRRRQCPAHMSGQETNWIIFIPFDTCPFRLGGSVLAETTGLHLGKASDMADPDYFVDCFEVVRELVEDGIVLSGITVADGGLMTALRRMTTLSCGLAADIGAVLKSYGTDDPAEVLLGEVPGALIEISDSDYDYLDAELLLQDVAFYPLGHPSRKVKGVRISSSDVSGISLILQALLNSQASEGED